MRLIGEWAEKVFTIISYQIPKMTQLIMTRNWYQQRLRLHTNDILKLTQINYTRQDNTSIIVGNPTPMDGMESNHEEMNK